MSGNRSMRVESPALDPDDAFVARLAQAARFSPRPVRRARRLGSWRLLMATAGIAVATTGGAYAAGVLGPIGPIGPLGRHDSPPHHQKSPASWGPTERTEPGPASPTGRANAGKPSAGRPTGQPSGQPSGVPNAGPSEHPTRKPPPSTKPHPATTSHPTGNPGGRPTGGGQPGGKPAQGPKPGQGGP